MFGSILRSATVLSVLSVFGLASLHAGEAPVQNKQGPVQQKQQLQVPVQQQTQEQSPVQQKPLVEPKQDSNQQDNNQQSTQTQQVEQKPVIQKLPPVQIPTKIKQKPKFEKVQKIVHWQ